MQGNVFVADRVLAKHDEKYMPPQVAKSLQDNPPPPDVAASTGEGT
jgi:cytochrome c-type biogenesis protein CcmE